MGIPVCAVPAVAPSAVAAVVSQLVNTPATSYLVNAPLTSAVPANWTGARASAGWHVGSDGVLVATATDEWRHDSSWGLLIEDASTNHVQNNTMVGATAGVLGSGGSLPTRWAWDDKSSGVTLEVIGTGTEDGLPYIELVMNGTRSGSTVWLEIAFEQSGQIAVPNGEEWCPSMFLKHISGSTTGDVTLTAITNDATHSQVQSNSNTISPLPTSIARYHQRYNIVQATAAWMVPCMRVVLDDTESCTNLRFRIYAPQVERDNTQDNFTPTSPILTDNNGTVTRAEDDPVIPIPSELTDDWVIAFTMRRPANYGGDAMAMSDEDGQGRDMNIISGSVTGWGFCVDTSGSTAGRLYFRTRHPVAEYPTEYQTVQMDRLGGDFAGDTDIRFHAAYGSAANEKRLFVDGEKATTGTALGVMDTASSPAIELGASGFGSGEVCHSYWIKDLVMDQGVQYQTDAEVLAV